jgi:hypothetical protein
VNAAAIRRAGRGVESEFVVAEFVVAAFVVAEFVVAEFVVAAAKVLYEGVPGDDCPDCAVDA